jgi:hypothetical protein
VIIGHPQTELAVRALVALNASRRRKQVRIGPGKRSVFSLHRAIANSKTYHRMARDVPALPLGVTRQMRRAFLRRAAA